jgi:hypothetical protein
MSGKRLLSVANKDHCLSQESVHLNPGSGTILVFKTLLESTVTVLRKNPLRAYLLVTFATPLRLG